MPKLHIAKLTAAGQISIPKPLREGFCQTGDYLTLEPYADGLLLRRVKPFAEAASTDEDYLKPEEVAARPATTANSIDWDSEEALPEFAPSPQSEAAQMESEATEAEVDTEEPVESEEPTQTEEDDSQRRKAMWKALMDSRAL